MSCLVLPLVGDDSTAAALGDFGRRPVLLLLGLFLHFFSADDVEIQSLAFFRPHHSGPITLRVSAEMRMRLQQFSQKQAWLVHQPLVLAQGVQKKPSSAAAAAIV